MNSLHEPSRAYGVSGQGLFAKQVAMMESEMSGGLISKFLIQNIIATFT